MTLIADLKEEVLRLPVVERAELAHLLLKSLDNSDAESEMKSHEAWEAELECRWRELEDGQATDEFDDSRQKYTRLS
jgi:putative addiction module component (TIGR02574 family)